MRKSGKFKGKMIFIISIIIIIFFICLYKFDKNVLPGVMSVADAEMRARAIQIINSTIIEEYSKEFNYDEIIHIDKDMNGNIVMVRADTLKMNKIACTVSLEAQKKLKEMGKIGIKVPLGYIFKNNFLAPLGPSVEIKMEPMGSVETKYNSEFESAGINQTRHKVYVEFKSNIKIIIPLQSNDMELTSEVPISETIIVGKVPENNVDLDLKGAGFKAEE